MIFDAKAYASSSDNVSAPVTYSEATILPRNNDTLALWMSQPNEEIPPHIL